MESIFYFIAAVLAAAAAVGAGIEATNGEWRNKDSKMTKAEKRKDFGALLRNAALIVGAIATLVAKGIETMGS